MGVISVGRMDLWAEGFVPKHESTERNKCMKRWDGLVGVAPVWVGGVPGRDDSGLAESHAGA